MATDTGMLALEESITGADGNQLFLRWWRPAQAARAQVIICPGFNSHGGHYTWVGEQLADAGLAACALDLRGRGRSAGERFYVDDVQEYAHDVGSAVALAKERAPGLPLFLLGHSAGGVVSCIYALDHQSELAGLVCESFAFEVPAPGIALAAIKGLSHIAPHLGVLKLNNADFSRDPEAVRRLNEDPLIHNETQPAETVAALVRADERLRRDFPLFTLPLLILHGSADKATKPSGSEFFYATASSADKTLKIYEGHYHDLLNDVGKEEVLADILAWIDKRLGAG